MLAWLESIAGPAYATAMMWTLGALLLLVVILLLIKVIRSLSFGTFVTGGRNRKTRLAVMDATAVDSHRRLVLVRRDDVEHLILIGGPTDVVVEQNIRLAPAIRRPVAEDQAMPREARLPPDAQVMTPTSPQAPAVPAEPQQAIAPPVPQSPSPPAPAAEDRPRPAARPASAAPAPAAPAAPPSAAAPLPAAPSYAPRPQPAPLRAIQPAAAAPAPRPQSPIPAPPAPARAVAHVAPPVAAPARPASSPPRAVNDQPPSLDDALLEELEVTLDRTVEQSQAPAARDTQPLPPSIEDEMSKLLGDLARPRR